MTRRGLIGGLGASLLALCARLRAVGTTNAPPRYGPVDLARHRVLASRGVFLHVFHRGQDVTGRCYFADDTGAGCAKLFQHRDGRAYLDRTTFKPAVETVYGVTFAAGDPPSGYGARGAYRLELP